jgi:hypothetical protein
MRLALYTDAFPDRRLEDLLDWLETAVPEISEVEIGTGGYSEAPHCPLRALLSDRSSLEACRGPERLRQSASSGSSGGAIA